MNTFGWIEALETTSAMRRAGCGAVQDFTTVAILTLALGIGANVAAFTAVRAVLLNPLPFPHPARLGRVFDDLRGSDSRDVGMSAPHENSVSASPLDKQVQMRDTASGRLHSIAK